MCIIKCQTLSTHLSELCVCVRTISFVTYNISFAPVLLCFLIVLHNDKIGLDRLNSPKLEDVSVSDALLFVFQYSF